MTRVVRLSVIILFVSLVAAAQVPRDLAAETNATVPALDDFHSVIATIWHQAWPTKDAALLRKLSPDVEKGIAEVASAKLPGILREKQSAWDDNIAKLQQIGADYKSAAASTDDTKLFAAAEKLHMQYEGLVRVIRPAMKELDQFHSALYPLYHYYLPEYNIEKIKGSVSDLQQRMAALNTARLPDRLLSKEAAFTAGRTKLAASLAQLATTIATNEPTKIKAAIEAMHSDYEDLSKVFD